MTGPVGVAVVGCGTISREYLGNLTSFPDLRVLFCADLDVGRAKQAGRRVRRAPSWDGGPGAAAAGRGTRRQPHHPRRPRRGHGGRAGCGQERLDREAARPRHRHRPAPARPGGAGWPAARLRTRHRARRRAADRTAADRRRGDRRAADGAGADAEPRPGALAPRSGVPVPARRGTAVRHRAVLPVLAGHDLRPGRAGRGRRPSQPRHQGHRPRAAGRNGIPRRGPDPRLPP